MFSRRDALYLLGAGCLVAGPLGCERDETKAAEKQAREPRGKMVTEERRVPEFEGIVVVKKGELKIEKGALGPARITGPDNYVADLELRSENKKVGERTIAVLVVELPMRIVPPAPEIALSVPNISYVEVRGGGKVELGDFSADSITLRVEDAGKIVLAPSSYGTLHATASHAGAIVGEQVMVEEAHLDSTGPSQILLGQVARVKRDVQSPSRVSYQGQPEVLK